MKRGAFVLSVVFGALRVLGAPFRNLSFEEANTNFLTLDLRNNTLMGTVDDLLPGWKVFQGTNQLESIAFNGSSAFEDNGGGPVLITLGSPLSVPIDGKFSFAILAAAGGLTPEPLTLVQRADIPSDAQYLIFTRAGINKTPVVSIDGITLLEPIPVVADPPMMVANISQFAGKNVELSFGTRSFRELGLYEIDSIAIVVPEPAGAALFMVGALALIAQWGWRSRRARKR